MAEILCLITLRRRMRTLWMTSLVMRYTYKLIDSITFHKRNIRHVLAADGARVTSQGKYFNIQIFLN